MAAINELQQTPLLDLGGLLDARDGAMVTLVAGETQLVAHRAVLAARSAVFAAMLRHDSLEASSGRVDIPDVEGPVLRQLLAYLYTLQAPQTSAVAPQLLAAADKYGVCGLKVVCEQQVARQLTIENAAAAAVLAVRHSSPGLTEAAVDFIKAHNFQVMATQGWAEAVRVQPEDVVEVSRLLADSAGETSLPASTESRTTPGPRHHTDHSQAPATAAAATAPHRSTTTDDTAGTHLRSLSEEEKGRRLIQAAEEGVVEELRSLLAVGVDLDVRDRFMGTALHCAAREGHVEAVRCLVEAGADLGARNRKHSTPLHLAAAMGHTAVVRLLAAHSADLNARHETGWAPLHFAALHGRTESAAALLEAGALRAARNDLGNTPLDVARQTNAQQQHLVQMLTRGFQSSKWL